MDTQEQRGAPRHARSPSCHPAAEPARAVTGCGHGGDPLLFTRASAGRAVQPRNGPGLRRSRGGSSGEPRDSPESAGIRSRAARTSTTGACRGSALVRRPDISRRAFSPGATAVRRSRTPSARTPCARSSGLRGVADARARSRRPEDQSRPAPTRAKGSDQPLWLAVRASQPTGGGVARL
jgi:hypothetical protein